MDSNCETNEIDTLEKQPTDDVSRQLTSGLLTIVSLGQIDVFETYVVDINIQGEPITPTRPIDIAHSYHSYKVDEWVYLL